MKIGVSGWRLYGQRLGIGRYIEYQLAHWNQMLRPSEEVRLYVHEPFDQTPLNLSPAFSSRLLRPKLTNGLWENFLLPWAARDVDVIFGPSYTVPLAFGRSVVAIHSLDEVEPGALSRWHQVTYSQKYKMGAKRAACVIANSQSVKDRVQEVYGVPEDKIEVIWLGADDAFRPIDDPALLTATRRHYFGGDRPYVLFVGGLSKRRNVPVLMEAFGVVKERYGIPHGLLFVGPNRARLPLEELAQRFKIADSVVQTDGVFASHRELVPIYNAADVFVLPSSTEGFSLTMAEAMNCGTPVITSNKAALGEVANGYALTVDEPTVEALADALYRAVCDSEMQKTLRARSLARARELRWDISARKTLDVLRRVAAA